MVSNVGEGAHLLHQIEQEGNQVELYINQPDYRSVWDGLIPKTEKIEPAEGTVVVFDFSGMGDIADNLRKEGFATVAGSVFADELEQDRMFGLNLMEQAGIKVPYTAKFDDFSVDEVRSFLEEHDDGKRFVFKPSGKDLPCSLTYCSHDGDDLVRWAEYVDKYFGKEIESFILQEFKEGVCVSTEAWCDGNRFLRPLNHTVEVKKALNGELGQATGCAGNLVWAEHDETCRIISEGILRAERLIVESGYVGPMDLNTVVNGEGVWGLEWTPRFGYDAMPTLIKMLRGGVGKFMSDVAKGQASAVNMTDQFGAAVRVTIPPYPLEAKKLSDIEKVCPNVGVPIRGIPEGKEDCFYLFEVMADGDGLVHSVGSGVVADAIGMADDCYEAFDEPYELLDELIIPNKQYRTDLNEELSKMHAEVMEQEGCSVGNGEGSPELLMEVR
jgi:phosphoribosylamine--glycine ligase